MKFFIDTANISEVKEYAFLLDGVTTNPSLFAKESNDFNKIVRGICKAVNGEVSVEVISLKTEEMVKEGLKLHKIHKNVVVKIPMTEEGLKAIKELTKRRIKTNCTLIFSVAQAIAAAKAGATYVSPFIGRLDDIGQDGVQLVKDIKTVYNNYKFKTQILAASIRNPEHVAKAALAGADIATIPYKVIKEMLKHELTDKGLKKFLDDWDIYTKCN